jgi:hypothetical protein
MERACGQGVYEKVIFSFFWLIRTTEVTRLCSRFAPKITLGFLDGHRSAQVVDIICLAGDLCQEQRSLEHIFAPIWAAP